MLNSVSRDRHGAVVGDHFGWFQTSLGENRIPCSYASERYPVKSAQVHILRLGA